jgi:hypothetical protein
MQVKATYKIRKNGKQEVFEGSLEDVRKWLRQNSVTSTDAMKREGYQVLELDEFWGLVSDFPEFSLTEREGRGVLRSKMHKAKILFVTGLCLVAIALGVLGYTHWIPAFQETLDRKKFESEIASTESKIAVEFAQKIKELEQQVSATDKKYASELEKNKFLEGEKRAQDQRITKLISQVTEDAQRIRNLEVRASASDSVAKSNQEEARKLRLETERLQQKVVQVSRALPIKVDWADAVIGRSKVLQLRNPSLQDLELLITISCANGDTKVRTITIKSGETRSSRWAAELDHDLMPGETVVITHAQQPNNYDALRIPVPE